MKLIVQRVSQAAVTVNEQIVGKIGKGALIFLGITHTDTESQGVWLANKLLNLRIFEDQNGKLNQSLIDQKGSLLIISQFTLYADCKEGRRPSFIQAAPPEIAKPLYEHFILEMKKSDLLVETGIFGAKMEVTLTNSGPITLILER